MEIDINEIKSSSTRKITNLRWVARILGTAGRQY